MLKKNNPFYKNLYTRHVQNAPSSAWPGIALLGPIARPFADCRACALPNSWSQTGTPRGNRRGFRLAVQARDSNHRSLLGHCGVRRYRQLRRSRGRPPHWMVTACSAIGNVLLTSCIKRIIILLHKHLFWRNGEKARKKVFRGAVCAQRQVDVVIRPAVLIGIIAGKSPTIARTWGQDVTLGIMMMMIIMIGRLTTQAERVQYEGQSDRDNCSRHCEPPCSVC